MVDTTFSIISRTMLAGGEPREAAIIKRASAAFFSRISWEIAYAILRVPQWVPHPGTFCIYRATRALRSSVKSTVQRRRAEPTYGNDLLGRLLAARDTETNEPMTEEQLIDNLLTLLEAGHETTAKALTWTLYLLARAPEWQQRIREELHRVVGDARLTSQHVDDLKVTECVIKEAMRLYPPAPVMIRTPVHATTLGDHKIPAGSLVVIPIYCLHRHRKLWHDPDLFDPDRFLPDKNRQHAQNTVYAIWCRSENLPWHVLRARRSQDPACDFCTGSKF